MTFDEALEADRAKFELLNPPNGWGHYDGLVHFVDQYLQECKMNPEATVRVDL